MDRSQSQEVLDFFSRTTESIVGEPELREKLVSGRPLRIKYGVDCTAPNLHLGHAVNLWMMRYLQERGHRVVFLLGDLTTRIGDPTGRSQTRPVLDPDEIERNATAFVEQVSTVLLTEPEVFEVRRNSEWFGPMDTAQLMTLFSMVTHAQLMARDMFRERVARGREIGLHQLSYPVLQGYDSFAMESDLTIVGSDQLFNEMMGRHFQQRLGAQPQTVITTKITPGIDGGQKQSKSLDNYVALADGPDEKFGKLMRVPDGLVGEFAQVYTALPLNEVARIADRAASAGTGARDAKRAMAEAVVARYHGVAVARQSRQAFTRIFSEKRVPEKIPTLVVDRAQLSSLELMRRARPESSNNDLRRIMAQGGAALDGVKLADANGVVELASGAVLKSGSRRWHRIEVLSR